MENETPDLQFSNLGSFAACWPVSERGEEWADEHLPDERPVYIEFRYLADIVEGARADGLVCHG